ncbi:MAG: dTDP-4-dehydrorhamnose 3,5-epimerase [Chitinivibrionales bacterium]|nr:dTDP-4-dehydrorhamnose 3,5-epimerase [Chitinivibrionales bacterium]
MEFTKTNLEGVWRITPKVFQDQRGFFLESYSRLAFEKHGIQADFVQDNHSCSSETGVLRGLHFQNPPVAQSKLVRVIHGAVYDVVVDLRKASPTFGKWLGTELSEENFTMLFVPKGFAHGFCTLRPNTEFLYKVDEFYKPESESGIIYNDPDLAITWPVTTAILSNRDKQFGRLRDLASPF